MLDAASKNVCLARIKQTALQKTGDLSMLYSAYPVIAGICYPK